MSLIKWRDSYNTGVQQFDDEHHKIVEFIGILYEALRNQSSKEDVVRVSNELLIYTENHFSNEEKAMRSAKYPHLEEHIVEHNRLKKEVQRYQEIIKNDFQKGTSELYRFLRDWLIEHIMKVDKKYVPYLLKQQRSE